MFTGVIEIIGRVTEFSRNQKGLWTLGIETPKALRVKIGGSVAVNGACLTVVAKKTKRLFFHVVDETRRRTAFSDLTAGQDVHIELPMIAGSSRVEGHFVLGHVDGVGVIRRILKKNTAKSFFIEAPSGLLKYFVEKGSVAIDGVSLTLGKTPAKGFWVHLIPHTLKQTRFGKYRVGTRVNLETDILAKLAGKL
jgi:riboflavin synthase